MASKLNAVKYAVNHGVETWIANGRRPERLLDIAHGNAIGTRFLPRNKTASV
jgi:glutamate 5-kinase